MWKVPIPDRPLLFRHAEGYLQMSWVGECLERQRERTGENAASAKSPVNHAPLDLPQPAIMYVRLDESKM